MPTSPAGCGLGGGGSTEAVRRPRSPLRALTGPEAVPHQPGPSNQRSSLRQMPGNGATTRRLNLKKEPSRPANCRAGAQGTMGRDETASPEPRPRGVAHGKGKSGCVGAGLELVVQGETPGSKQGTSTRPCSNYVTALNQNSLTCKIKIIPTVSESCVRINELTRVT